MVSQLFKSYKFTSTAIKLAVFSCLAICLFTSGFIVALRLNGGAGAAALPVTSQTTALATYHQQLSQLYEDIVPSVVRLDVQLADISRSKTDPASNTPSKENLSEWGHASGFVWDTTGLIITNYHVVSAARRIQVTFHDGTTTMATIVGSDPNTDLAMLTLQQSPANLQPVNLANSSTVQTGDLALAIGVPFGQNFTLTKGIVSAVNRTLQTCASCYPVSQVIQTDTPLHPGNSGGPLFNQHGEVIGIVTWRMNRHKGDAGVGFALSSNALKQMVPSLLGD